MTNLTLLTESIYRLTVPFEDVYTTVFLILTPDGAVLYDTATYPEDVERYIIPALNSLGITEHSLKYIVISHDHGDHSGGLARMLQSFPHVTVISLSSELKNRFTDYTVLSLSDEEYILKCLQIIKIPGHSEDCTALLDERSHTLITGDCLQMYGLYGSGIWGSNIPLPADHLKALKKLHSLNIRMMIAAHDYHPFGYLSCGESEISRCLNACAAAISDIKNFICAHPGLSDTEAAALYHQSTGLPPVGSSVFEAIRTSNLPNLDFFDH